MSAVQDLFAHEEICSFRLFAPPDTGTQRAAAGALTLRAAFTELHLPEIEHLAPNTLAEYETQLRHWEQRTPNPPVGEVTDETLLALKKSMLAEQYSPATIGKTLRTLSPIFQTLARKGLIDRVPRTKLPRVDLPEPRVASNGQLSRLYAACDSVRITRGPSRGAKGAALFRAALVLFFNVGLRHRDLWHLKWPALDLERGTITLRVRKNGRAITRPLHACAIRHLREIGPAKDGRVFPLSHSTIVRWWTRMRARAKVSLTFHDLRRTCQTRFDELRLGLGDWMLDHRSRDVGGMYYRNLARLGRKAARRLKQPKAFLAVRQDPQLRLF